MTQLPDDLIDRRSYLRRLGITAATVGGLSAPAAARGGDTLEGRSGFFSVYAGIGDNPEVFEFPEKPFFAGPNPFQGVTLFDSSDIRITPNQNTLHHELQVFAGLLMEDKPKPYTLVNVGEGLFEARGQTVNFTARPKDDIEDDIDELPIVLPDDSLLSMLAGNRWRAVATEQIQLDLSDTSAIGYEWAATRVDFYTRGGGRPENVLSLIYVLWAGENDSPQKENAEGHAETLIESGPLNMGGQSPKPR